MTIFAREYFAQTASIACIFGLKDFFRSNSVEVLDLYFRLPNLLTKKSWTFILMNIKSSKNIPFHSIYNKMFPLYFYLYFELEFTCR